MKIEIKNCNVFTKGKLIHSQNILIDSGKFKIVHDVAKDAIDGCNLLLSSGFADMQVHLRDPGQTHKENFKTGLSAAAHGGFVSVLGMPNTTPTIDNAKTVQDVLKRSAIESTINYYTTATMTIGMKGEECTNFKELKSAGALALTDDGIGVESDEVMENIFKKNEQVNLPLLQHAEFRRISNLSPLSTGEGSKKLNIRSQDKSAEWKMIERDINLLKKYPKNHYHVLHVSTKESVDLIRAAKDIDLNITAEASPHHLTLTNEMIIEDDANFKMNPPLRNIVDTQALINGLKDGTIDIIATDHAPHSFEEKKVGIEKAPFGIIGLETAFPVLYTNLVLNKKISLELLLQLLSTNPAKIYNLKEINNHEEENFTLIDLDQNYFINEDFFLSKSKNSPFIGRAVKGKILLTVAHSKVAYKNEEL